MPEHMVSATPTTFNSSVNCRLIAGSHTSWRLARIAEILAVPLAFLFNIGPMYGRVSAILSLLFILIMVGEFHQLAYGFLDRDGIRYKRYFKWKTVRWEEIESVSRSPLKPVVGSILVDLKNGSPFNRRISFSPNPVILGKPTNDATYDDLRNAWLESVPRNLNPTFASNHS